ncbi:MULTISPECIES: CapA family protein [Trichocoleus]|uniref:CapA family protein n=1 Tax=Trichocoleus desertorum GB2-A4 TaxID=2933944 RepID=A0ABV0J868_9CYAN|nr:CapA family protein [Trichocoleus sp. FACHB-46]MBD1860989.1 CapA family protein [Trichocoleus sp. FACHB-46]
MAYSNRVSQPSVLELAREGNVRAIAYWLNSYLVPQGVYASIRPTRSNCLHITVEFDRIPERDRLVRFICHRLCQLNLDFIEGVRIAARFADESQTLWQQSVRLATSSRRQKRPRQPANRPQATQSISVKQLLDQRVYLKLARSLLLSGSAVAAFVLGCLLSYNETPTEPTIASANGRTPETTLTRSEPNRPNAIRAALETVPVVQHQNLLNPDDPAVTLMFGGDVTLSDAFEDLVGQDYNWAFADMKEYRQADVAMVNLENPLTRATSPLPDKQFNFKADPESVEVLTDGGIDIVTLANNHAMDYEASGLIETLETLEQAGIHHIGAGRDIKEARRPEILEVKGQRIAYLGYYDADLHAADIDVAGTNPTRNDRIAEDIRAIRKQVDWIVVNYHWGEELAEYPVDMQIQLAHHTIDKGADLVVGHHPHVLQGAEIYKGRPIVYSLGNFIFGGNSRSDYDTAVLKVALRDKQMKVEFLPVEVTQYQPRIVSGDRGEQILNQIRERSSLFAQPMPSSVILDARSSEVVEPGESEVFREPSLNPDATNVAPSPQSTPETTSPDSFITTPDSAPDDLPASPDERSNDPATPLNSQPFAPDTAPSNSAPAFPDSEPSPSFSNPEPADNWQSLPSQPTAAPSPDPTDAWPDGSTTPEPFEPDAFEPDAFKPDRSNPSLDSEPSESAPAELEPTESEPSELNSEPESGYTYPHRQEPDDYWQPLTPDPSEPPDELVPSDDTSPDPGAPLNSQPEAEPFTKPENSTEPFESSPLEGDTSQPLNGDTSSPLNQTPAPSPTLNEGLEPFTDPVEAPADDTSIPENVEPRLPSAPPNNNLEPFTTSPEDSTPLEAEPSIAPTTAPSDRLEPFITNPAETVPTAPTVAPDSQQGNSSPEPVLPQAEPSEPKPFEPPSHPKQHPREHIALLEHQAPPLALSTSTAAPSPVLSTAASRHQQPETPLATPFAGRLE